MSGQDNTKLAGDVIANINYVPATGTPIPTSVWETPYLGITYPHTRPMTIRDVRLAPKHFSLNTNGFQFVKLPPQKRVTAADDDDTIKSEYYPELRDLIQALYVSSSCFTSIKHLTY